MKKKKKIDRFWEMGKEGRGLNPVTMLDSQSTRLTSSGIEPLKKIDKRYFFTHK